MSFWRYLWQMGCKIRHTLKQIYYINLCMFIQNIQLIAYHVKAKNWRIQNMMARPTLRHQRPAIKVNIMKKNTANVAMIRVFANIVLICRKGPIRNIVLRFQSKLIQLLFLIFLVCLKHNSFIFNRIS